jgi:hypothetical protein
VIRRFLAVILLAAATISSHTQPALPSSFQSKMVHAPGADIFVRWGGKGPVVVHWLMEEKPEYTVALIRKFIDAPGTSK